MDHLADGSETRCSQTLDPLGLLVLVIPRSCQSSAGGLRFSSLAHRDFSEARVFWKMSAGIKYYEYIVVGLGGVGSGALYWLAKRAGKGNVDLLFSKRETSSTESSHFKRT